MKIHGDDGAFRGARHYPQTGFGRKKLIGAGTGSLGEKDQPVPLAYSFGRQPDGLAIDRTAFDRQRIAGAENGPKETVPKQLLLGEKIHLTPLPTADKRRIVEGNVIGCHDKPTLTRQIFPADYAWPEQEPTQNPSEPIPHKVNWS